MSGHVNFAVGDDWWGELHRRTGQVPVPRLGAVVKFMREVVGFKGV
jgi:hypothetical protein